MISHHRQLSRRGFLAGAGGAVLGLPWLESFGRAAGVQKREKPSTRLAFFYLPNGITRRGFFPGEGDRKLPDFAGQNNVWRFEGKTVPPGSHPLTFTPTLAPLHKMRDKITLLTGILVLNQEIIVCRAFLAYILSRLTIIVKLSKFSCNL